MSDTTAFSLRLLIVLACLLAVVLMVLINHPVRRSLSFGHVMTRLGVVVVLLSIAYSTVESHLQHVPGSSRLWVLSAGLIWLDVGQVALLRERTRTRVD